MSDNKETKQAPAIEAGARDLLHQSYNFTCYVAAAFASPKERHRDADRNVYYIQPTTEDWWEGLREDLEELQPKLKAALARASEAAAGEPVLPQGFSAKRVEGHGWVIDPPSGTRWVAYEGTPAGELMQALAAPQPASGQKANHVLVPRELLQDFIDDVEEYAASREFKAREVVWRGERIVSARALLAAKGDGHAD